MVFRAALLAFLFACACRSNRESRGAPRPESRASTPAAPLLAFHDFFQEGEARLVPSATLARSNGKRVRMIGHMAQMEVVPRNGFHDGFHDGFYDGFYLVPRPLACDEAGGGTADLPPDAVRVVMTSRTGQMPFVPGPVQVEGRLEVGSKEHPDGTVSHVRLILGAAAIAPTAAATPQATTGDRRGG